MARLFGVSSATISRVVASTRLKDVNDPAAITFTVTSMSRSLIIFGVVLIAAGLLWPVFSKLGLGRLPGDIVIERENFRLYIPIATSIVVSFVLSLLLWLLNR